MLNVASRREPSLNSGLQAVRPWPVAHWNQRSECEPQSPVDGHVFSVLDSYWRGLSEF
jgi:hypothetical protein